ncbi:hypothetical protein CWI75_06790 [Kineobactrum sediminis]|uniref:Peptidase S1 domain-containing protein n=1 Tax=Kineobactrum sediminis TaxID=1905677 RepID=A0A2N5Y3Z7_9GAMM|nr:serine protease [Kineobactrum sediminis]PLW83120.1 hypothetical protein CWI75_06790 [Kineobactrum sediminis]
MTNILIHEGENPLNALFYLRLCLLPMLVACGASGNVQAGNDNRIRYDSSSPHWLQAIGQLRVPGVKYESGHRRHYTERCSATLVATTSTTSANTIITAWHCLEFYRDLTHKIVFTLLPEASQPLRIEAVPVTDGGSMQADWAILRLRQAVPGSRIQPLSLHPRQADPGLPLVMAGYSRDTGIGAGGNSLSYDPACHITRNDSGKNSGHRDSDCRAFKGASGGAVVQFSGDEPLLSGVISEGDGAELSRFVPISIFRHRLHETVLQ